MQSPEMKQEYDLTVADFARHPVWVGVHNYDTDQPWYEEADEETFRPWVGPLPFDEARGVALLAAIFQLADGSSYRGFCRSVREDWDRPIDSPKERGVARQKALSWSRMHGGGKRSVMSLQSPVIFIDDHQFDFQLGVPRVRASKVQKFYAAIGKEPRDVFPLRFVADAGLATGLTSGKLAGFYDFPMWEKSFEIDTGEALIGVEVPDVAAERASGLCEVSSEPVEQCPETERRFDLSLEDFRRHPVWVRVPFPDESRPWYAQHAYIPWSGALPVDSQKEDVRIPADFVLRDGSKYPGYITAAPEDWADRIPTMTLPWGKIVESSSPRVRFVDSPLAIIGTQMPFLFINERKFFFWCELKTVDDLRRPFYECLKKRASDIFPIRFEGTPGLATGIVSGEIKGFYKVGFADGPPRVVR